jgi:membrane protein YqaA with SNARE-associated domain
LFVTSEDSNLIPVGSPYTLTSALVNVLPDLVASVIGKSPRYTFGFLI